MGFGVEVTKDQIRKVRSHHNELKSNLVGV